MSLLDSVTNFFTGNTGPLISGAASLIGGVMGNQQRAAQAQSANAFSAQQFATRYQTTVKDMEAAGLNPMLAYSQGGGSPPSGVQAQQEDVVTPGVNSFNQTRSTNIQNQLATAQVNNINADTANKGAAAKLMEAQANQANASAYQAGTQGALNEKTVDQVNATIGKILADTNNVDLQSANLKVQKQVLQATVEQIVADTMLSEKKWLTEGAQYQHLKALIGKVMNDTKLSDLDIKAAESFDNFGRNAEQIRPILDIIKQFLRK